MTRDQFVSVSFNPCFGGTPFQTGAGYAGRGSIVDVSILVLVELPFRQYTAPVQQVPVQRFNPCFGGTPFQTFRGIVKRREEFWFQSLFWWNSLSDPGHSSRCQYELSVSILVLVELPFRP